MSNKASIGIDIGGTKTIIGLISDTGIIIRMEKFMTEASKGPDFLIDRITNAVNSTLKEEISGIGIGFAGLVDNENGVIIKGPNFPNSFNDLSLAKIISEKLGVTCKIDNDVKCFTLAEATYGAGKGYSKVFGMTLGTGVGGAMLIDGKIYRGHDNLAGEIGHVTIDMDSPYVCSCGQHGHLESFASGKSLLQLGRECGYDAKSVGEMMDIPNTNDKCMQGAIQTFRDGLAAGFQNIIYTLNPEIIIIGGGMSRHEDLWRPAAEKALSGIIFEPGKSCRIEISTIGETAPVVGAAMLVKT